MHIYIYAGALVISIKDINLVVGVQYQLAGVPLISWFYPEGLTDQGRLEAREKDPPTPCVTRDGKGWEWRHIVTDFIVTHDILGVTRDVTPNRMSLVKKKKMV